MQHHAPAVVSHHADPVYVEEQPAVIARTAPVATVAYTPESVAAVAHRAETAYIQGSAQWDITNFFSSIAS